MMEIIKRGVCHNINFTPMTESHYYQKNLLENTLKRVTLADIHKELGSTPIKMSYLILTILFQTGPLRKLHKFS